MNAKNISIIVGAIWICLMLAWWLGLFTVKLDGVYRATDGSGEVLSIRKADSSEIPPTLKLVNGEQLYFLFDSIPVILKPISKNSYLMHAIDFDNGAAPIGPGSIWEILTNAVKVTDLENNKVEYFEKLSGDEATQAVAWWDENNPRLLSRKNAVLNNLKMFASAASQYMIDLHATKARYSDLVGTNTDDYIRSISPVAGEDYTPLEMTQSQTQISITATSFGTVTYNL